MFSSDSPWAGATGALAGFLAFLAALCFFVAALVHRNSDNEENAADWGVAAGFFALLAAMFGAHWGVYRSQ